MPKPILDPAAIARLRAELENARSGNIMDRVIAIEAALEAVLVALGESK